ncbi:hypothetical protein [Phyllobacterium sp. K27]
MNNLPEDTDDGEDGGNVGAGAMTSLSPSYGPSPSKRGDKSYESFSKSENATKSSHNKTETPDPISETQVEIGGFIYTIRMVDGEYEIYDENMDLVGKSDTLEGAIDIAANDVSQKRLKP